MKMCYFLLLVDSINGFFANQGIALPISSLYKFILLGLMLARLLSFKRPSPFLYLIYIATLFLYYSLYDYSIFSSSFSFISRYLIIIILYEYLLVLSKHYNISFELYRILKFNFIIIIFNVLLGLFGIGYGTYDHFGSKGFFYAGNETSGVLLTISPIILYTAIKRYTLRSYKFLTIMAGTIVAAVLLGTKSALLGIFIILFFIIWKYSYINKTYIIIFLGATTTSICYYIYNHFSYMIDHFLFAFYKRDMGWRALLSSRDLYYDEIMTDFYNTDFISSFFGMGMPQKTIEIDFFDFLYISGYIGVIFLIIFWIINIVKSSRKGEIASLVLFTNFLLIGISFLAGHIYSSAMAGPFIAIINILPIIEYQFRKVATEKHIH